MMPGPGGAIRREAKRVQGRLIWVLVLGTLLRLGTGCGVQDSRLGRVSTIKLFDVTSICC